jgi:hypothetical protein
MKMSRSWFYDQRRRMTFADVTFFSNNIIITVMFFISKDLMTDTTFINGTSVVYIIRNTYLR